MQLTLQPVTTQAQIATVAEIARTVWHATYDPLLPPGQVDYMLEKYQSPAAIRAQQA